MAAELLDDGIIIMVLGMGMVFCFLTILMFVMNLNRIIAEKLEAVFVSSEPAKPKAQKRAAKTDDAHVAIAVALAHHLKRG